MRPAGRFVFPGQKPSQEPVAHIDEFRSERHPPSTKPDAKSDLELKREALRKKKEELEKKLLTKANDPVKQVEKPTNEAVKEGETEKKPEEKKELTVQVEKPLSNAELLKRKKEELERKKKLGEQAGVAQPENTSKLEELKKKYQKSAEIPDPASKSPEEKPNKLEELRKKYQNNVPSNNSLLVPNRISEPMYRNGMGKSVSTTHVSCESKTFKFPAQEQKNKEEEKTEKEDFLKKMEQIQASLDKKLDRIKKDDVEEKSPQIVVIQTRSMDLGQPAGINLNQYRQNLKKNLLSINPEAEKLMNMPKKILTPSGMKIHSSLADRVAGLEALFGGSASNEDNQINEMKPEIKKKIEEEIEICLKLYHLSLERPELPEKRQKGMTLRKRLSKEWI